MAFESRLELTVDSRSGEKRLKDFEQSLERTEKAGERVSQGMGVLKTAIGGAVAAAGGFSVSRIVSESARFEDSMLGLQAVSSATEKQMKSLEKQARTLGATSAFSAQQAGQAQRFLAQAGFEVNEVLSATPGILDLATAGQMNLAQAADIASNVLGGMRLEVDQLNRVNDVLAATAGGSNTSISQLGQALSTAAPLAASAGVSIEETAAAIGTLSDAGIQAERAGTGLQGIFRQLSNVTPQARDALASYGVSLQDVNIEANGLGPVLESLRDANISTADAFKIFGSEAGAAAQILLNGAGRVQSFSEELNNSEGAAREMALTIGSGLSGSMRAFNSALSESVLQLGDSGLSGGFQSVTDTASGLLSVYNGMLPEFAEANNLTHEQANNLQTMAGALSAAAGATGALGGAYVTTTAATWGFHAAQKALNKVVRANPYVVAATSLVALTGALYGARNATVELGDTDARVQDWLRASWQETSERVGNLVGHGYAAASEATGEFGQAVDQVTSYVWSTFQALMGNIAGAAQHTVNGVIAYFLTVRDTFGIVARTVRTSFENAFDNVLNMAKGLWQDIQAIFSGDFSFSNFQAAVNSAITDPLKGAASEVRAAFEENFSRDYLGELADYAGEKLGELGTDISDTAFRLRYLNNDSGLVAEGFQDVSKSGDEASQSLQEVIEQAAHSTIASDDAAESSSELAKELERQAKAARSLLDELYPVQASQREYAEQKQLLTQYAEREGKSNQWLEESLRRLQNQYRNAGTAAEAYGLDGSKAMEKVEDSVDPMATAFERGIERMDDAAVDMWRSFLDGSEGAFDSFKNLALDTLAEVIHAYTTRQITTSIGAQIGIGGQGAAIGGQSGGGGFDQLASVGSNMLNTGGQVFTNAWNAFQGAGSTYAGQFGAELAVQTQGGLEAGFNSFANSGAASNALSGIYTAGGAIAGSYLGGEVAGAISDKHANSNYGQMAGTAIGTAVLPGIGTAVGSALGTIADTLFGSGGSDLDISMQRRASSQGHAWDHGIVAQGGLGAVGFNDDGSHEVADLWDIDEAQQLVDSIAKLDTAVASLAETPEQLAAMRDAVLASNRHGIQGHYGETSHPDEVVDRLTSRYEDAFGALDAEFAEFLQGLDGSIDQVVEKGLAARQAFSFLSDAAERLDLRFDDTTASAYEAASSLAEMAGGVQNLSSLQQNYYQTLYSEEERLNQLRSDVTQQLNAMGMSLPRSRDGFRELVEAQDLNTEAGQRNYTQLLQLVDSFDRLADSGALVNAEVAKLDDQIASLKGDVKSAWETFDQQSFDQRISLLQLAGESEQALALQRERELETIDKSLRPFQERFWALQDEAKAQEEAAQAGRDYAEALASARDSLGSTFDNISGWLDQLRSTDQGGGTPREQLTAARSAFNEQLQLARSGDRTALQNITQYADRLIDAQRNWSASGGATASIIERVENQLGNLPDQVSAEQFIADEIKQALIEQTAGITSQLADVLRSDTPSNIAQQLAGSFDDLTRGIGDVLTREQLAVVMDGKATDAQLDAVMRAVDLNGDGVMSGLESVIIKSMPTDATLANALQNQLEANGNKALTADQVRQALSPIASNERINQLIDRIDVNGDGLLSAQEITSARIGGLSGGIAQSLSGYFDELDANLDGKLTFDELSKGLDGLATDAQLRAMMQSMDIDMDGVISGLESVIISEMPTDARLTNVLRNQMERSRNQSLSYAEVREALSPVASKAVINRLINKADRNADGVITAQELNSLRISELTDSVISTLDTSFDQLDANLDGKLTFKELQAGLDGMATDAQLKAMMARMDLNADGIISGFESVVVQEMPSDTRLATVLRNQMHATRTRQLTHAQIREALSGIARKPQIDRLINRADVNADGIITAQELANARLDGLASGIGGALSPMFDSIDTSLDGLINYDEFGKQFSGMASDAQLKRIFDKLDVNGDGTISRLEALKHSSDEVGDNTKSIEERALDQVSKLGDLVTDMTASTNQLVSLDSSVSDLAGVIEQMNAVQAQRAQEERQHEQKMAQMAYYSTRQAAGEKLIEQMGVNQEKIADARNSLNQNQIEHLTGFVDSNQAQGATAWMDQEDWERIRENIQNNDNMSRDAKQFVLNMAAYRLRNRRLTAWENIVAGHEFSPDSLELSAFAKGGVFTNSVVDEPTLFNMGVMGEANPEAIMPLHRGPDGGLGIRAELPPIPALPLLGQNDIVETLQDLYREVAALRAENKRLLGESNEHLGAANRQRGAAAKRQIEEQQRGNEALERISSESQLVEASR
ncbi:phage tail tape measure protein [Halomonas caseinilytica]|uniref:phage tail tape measure protein n=1 Tax=Halomonas caseinilytica TaxID=438744 RepID=UPI0007E543AE|nr:phage tail tape measure protein [Halomonas caseinilytica]SEM67361.1 phage tail tape measure protein, TP901 family, core region [Halomonas caseinilytica]